MRDYADSEIFENPSDGAAGKVLCASEGAKFAPPADNRFADPTIAKLRMLGAQEAGFLRARVRLELQAQAEIRSFFGAGKEDGSKLYSQVCKQATPDDIALYEAIVAPFIEAMNPLRSREKSLTKEMEKLVKTLPVWKWCDGQKGLGAASAARMIAQCGDFTEYRSISALWKRAGLAVIDGERQRRVTGDAAIIHGYSPYRRSVFWNMCQSFFKAQGTAEKGTATKYRLYYDAQKARQLEINSDTLGAPSKADPTKRVCVLKHADNRAMRKLTGKIVQDMANAWCREIGKSRMKK